MIVRKATENDIPFIIETIIYADKGIHQKLSYSQIFDITEEEFIEQLPAMLEEDIEGQEICISGYVIVENDGIPLAACCAWIEQENQESNAIKSTLLRYFFDAKKLVPTLEIQKVLKELYIPRTPNSLQIESVYVSEEARGKGIIKQMFDWQIEKYPKIKAVEIMLTSDNEIAQKAYQKYGFKTYKKSKTKLDILPFSGMNLMRKMIDKTT